jgi:hypothetical protein
MARLRQLIHEVHRRSLWQVLGIYIEGETHDSVVPGTVSRALKAIYSR